MIELRNDTLVFSFPEIHRKARLEINIQRTFRIPDDGKSYPLPPGIGAFPVKHVDDFTPKVPSRWIEHGGVMLPMHQSEAMWLHYDAEYIRVRATSYPFAIKVAAGKINAVTGSNWTDWLQRKPQDYMVWPEQPWLDGYCVKKGIIRQFVAMPLGSGYSAEEQLTKAAEHGGIQIIVYPMKREVFEKRFPKREIEKPRFESQATFGALSDKIGGFTGMGLAAGGCMHQEIYEDPFDLNDWEMNIKSRCFVHIANSLTWEAITGEKPPTLPLTARDYACRGLPWFDYYSERSIALKGSKIFKRVKNIIQLGKEKRENPLPDNESASPDRIVKLRKGLKEEQVREGNF